MVSFLKGPANKIASDWNYVVGVVVVDADVDVVVADVGIGVVVVVDDMKYPRFGAKGWMD